MNENSTDCQVNPEIEKYQAKLNELLDKNSSAIFANYSQGHARCIIRTFLNAATQSVVVLSGDFGCEFHQASDLRAALISAVERGVHVRVISLGTSDQSVDRLNELKRNLDANSPSGHSTFDFRIGVVREGMLVQHYMVVDGRRYRLETAHANPAPESVHAEVCCNGEEKAMVLGRSFNAIWTRLS